MIAKRPEDRFASMNDVAAALDAYLAGQPTGVSLSRTDDTTSQFGGATLDRPPVRGVTVSPWTLAIAVATVVGAFGVTWYLIAQGVKQQTGVEEIKVPAATRKAVEEGQANVVFNDKELTAEQLKKPLGFPLARFVVGENKLVITTGKNDPDVRVSSTSADDEPSYLVKTEDGYGQKWNHRAVAEWVLSNGGKLKLSDGDTWIEKVDSLPGPKTRFQSAEIDLSDVSAIPEQSRYDAIGLLKSLKKLVLPQNVSQDELKSLQKALPDCDVKKA
jgi:hypothetical protein